MTANPLTEIRRVEREVSAAIADAKLDAEGAVAEARRQADQVVADARMRGLAAAERRYQDGLVRARDTAQRILSDGDERVATLRRQAEAHLPAAVDKAMEMVMPKDV